MQQATTAGGDNIMIIADTVITETEDVYARAPVTLISLRETGKLIQVWDADYFGVPAVAILTPGR